MIKKSTHSDRSSRERERHRPVIGSSQWTGQTKDLKPLGFEILG